jgi:protein O-GlcNAc transferase
MDLAELANAEHKLRQITFADPLNACSWEQLGSNLRLQGKLAEAEGCCRKAVELDGSNSEFWRALGICLSNQRRWSDAADCFRKALTFNPRNGQASSDLAAALFQQGQFEEAEQHAFASLDTDGNNATFWTNYGAALLAQRKSVAAADAFRKAAELEPNNSALWSNLGAAEQACGNLVGAKQALERSLSINRNDLGAATNYASVLSQMGKSQEGIEILQGVLRAHPQFARAWFALGSAFKLQAKYDDAVVALRHAEALAPRQFEVLLTLASVFYLQGKLSEVEELARQLLSQNPNAREAWTLLGGILDKQFRREEALAALQRAQEIQPDAATDSEILRQSQYAESVTAEGLFQAHRDWAAKFAGAELASIRNLPAKSVVARRLRIGFVSSDFCGHPIGFLARPCLENLDKQRCQVICYSDVMEEDGFSARFRAASDLWRSVVGLTNEQLARQIELDEIDVLVDLMGHTGSRMPVFAREPAACQISWLGYVGTTGLRTMDYVLADKFHVREGEENFYVEKILRMPHVYACYEFPLYTPSVEPLPALSRNGVVFGCFNNTAKYTPRIFQLWSQILLRVPTAKLLLKFGSLGDSQLHHRVLEQFTKSGIDASRIECEGSSPHRDLLAAYNRVDIALDTQPYSGGVTTCESLLMGVPVITFPGKTFAGRHATSYLTNAGFGQFVAENKKGYVELAVRWANRLPELATIRAAMREQLRNSPVCDAPQFARDFLDVVQHAVESQRTR